MTTIVLPNIRKLFKTDPGYVMYEADLKGADAQVVAWEAEDDDLKAAFRSGIDVHAKNAEDMLGREFTQLKGHLRDAKRQENKKAVHATNYGAAARTIAASLGWTVHESERFQHRWFTLHPGIKRNFHGKIQSDLRSKRTVTNAFGFRRVYYDRIDSCFAEALAWVPQSTVALNTYHGAFQIERRYWPDHQLPHYFPTPDRPAGIILQTHDSINFQFPLTGVPDAGEVAETLKVLTPYPDPLYIPWDLKWSRKSWGDMEKIA